MKALFITWLKNFYRLVSFKRSGTKNTSHTEGARRNAVPVSTRPHPCSPAYLKAERARNERKTYRPSNTEVLIEALKKEDEAE